MSNRFIYEKCPVANGMPDRKISLRREQNFHTYAEKCSIPLGWPQGKPTGWRGTRRYHVSTNIMSLTGQPRHPVIHNS